MIEEAGSGIKCLLMDKDTVKSFKYNVYHYFGIQFDVN